MAEEQQQPQQPQPPTQQQQHFVVVRRHSRARINTSLSSHRCVSLSVAPHPHPHPPQQQQQKQQQASPQQQRSQSLSLPAKKTEPSEDLGSPPEPTRPAPRPRLPQQQQQPAASADPADIWVHLRKRHDAPAPLFEATASSAALANVANEIVQTERDFVRDLAFVSLFYALPLKGIPRSLTPAEHGTLFGGVEPILAVSFELLRRLEALAPARADAVAEVFAEMADFLKVYTSYCATQPQRIALLKKVVDRSAEFRSFINDVRMLPESHQLDLDSFLMRPVQRVCKFPLLLRELSRAMPSLPEGSGSSTRTKLESTIEKIQGIVDRINTSAHSLENSMVVTEIQRRLLPMSSSPGSTLPEIVTPARRFVKEGPALCIEGIAEREVNLVLFNDALLVTILSGKRRLRMLEWIALGDVILENNDGGQQSDPPPPPPPPSASTEGMPIVLRSSSLRTTFMFIDNTRVGWRAAISEHALLNTAFNDKPWFCPAPQVLQASASLEIGQCFLTDLPSAPASFKAVLRDAHAIREIVVERRSGGFCCKEFVEPSTGTPTVFKTPELLMQRLSLEAGQRALESQAAPTADGAVVEEAPLEEGDAAAVVWG